MSPLAVCNDCPTKDKCIDDGCGRAKANHRAATPRTDAAAVMGPSDWVLAAIDSEPELPGDMPDAMWEAIRNDRDACAAAMRIVVRQTKAGIRGRYLAAALYFMNAGEPASAPQSDQPK